MKTYKEVESGRIRMRKKGEFKEDTLGIHCKWWRNRQWVPVKKLTKINPLKSPGSPNPRHPRDHAPGEMNWCERSCEGAIRPNRDGWGPHSVHTLQSHLQWGTPLWGLQSCHLNETHPSSAHNGCILRHGWDGRPNDRYDTQVDFLYIPMNLTNKKINTNSLEPKTARPNWVWHVEGKDKGG